MTSLGQRDHCLPTFVAERPHFMKIILADTKQIAMLRIPTKFTKMHGNSLSSTLCLRVPNGGMWKVDVVKNDGDLWLQNGWKEFAQYYSLEYRSLLVFRYNGNSNFWVLIFDKTASEIDYPIRNIKCEEPDSEEISYRNDLPIQILDEWSTHASPQKKKKKINPTSETQNGAYLLPSDSHFATTETKSNILKLEKSRRYLDRSSRDLGDNRSIGDRVRKRRMEPKVEPSELSTDSLDDCSPRQRQESKVRNKQLVPKDIAIRQRPSSSATAKALEPAGRSNPSFKCVMSAPYIRARTMNVPGDMMKELTQKSAVTVMLKVADKLWPVNLLPYENSKCGKLSAGFSAFLRENDIGLGDECVFELINKDGRILNVTILSCGGKK